MSGRRTKILQRRAALEVRAGLPDEVLKRYRPRREAASAGILRRHQQAVKKAWRTSH